MEVKEVNDLVKDICAIKDRMIEFEDSNIDILRTYMKAVFPCLVDESELYLRCYQRIHNMDEYKQLKRDLLETKKKLSDAVLSMGFSYAVANILCGGSHQNMVDDSLMGVFTPNV